jgi:hypothetical protein
MIQLHTNSIFDIQAKEYGLGNESWIESEIDKIILLFF